MYIKILIYDGRIRTVFKRHFIKYFSLKSKYIIIHIFLWVKYVSFKLSFQLNTCNLVGVQSQELHNVNKKVHEISPNSFRSRNLETILLKQYTYKYSWNLIQGMQKFKIYVYSDLYMHRTSMPSNDEISNNGITRHPGSHNESFAVD